MKKQNYPSIFKVIHSQGSGSCFYLKNYDLFVTNSHVIEGFQEVAIEDNQRNRYLTKVIFANPSLDIAFLKATNDFSTQPALELATEKVHIGDKIFVAGYPFGMPLTVTKGTVSSPQQYMDGHHHVQTDAAVNPGNSGGPMFNAHGKVLAVTTSKFTNADNMGFGIPASSIVDLLEKSKTWTSELFHLQCTCCDHILSEEKDYCPYCGNKLSFYLFTPHPSSELTTYCEKAIQQMGINPVLSRIGHESWNFHSEKSEIRIFNYQQEYLFCTSPLNFLPKENFEPIFNYLFHWENFTPYKIGIHGNQIFLFYRIHLADISVDSKQEIFKNIIAFPKKADQIATYLHQTFHCPFSEYSRKSFDH